MDGRKRYCNDFYSRCGWNGSHRANKEVETRSLNIGNGRQRWRPLGGGSVAPRMKFPLQIAVFFWFNFFLFPIWKWQWRQLEPPRRKSNQINDCNRKWISRWWGIIYQCGAERWVALGGGRTWHAECGPLPIELIYLFFSEYINLRIDRYFECVSVCGCVRVGGWPPACI